MDKEKLKSNLKYLVNKYIDDINIKKQLLISIENPEAKYFLGEIERNKKIDYSDIDRELIKDIYFYFC